MPSNEIKALRQQGKLKEALSMALDEYKASPEDRWCKINLAWVYDSFCKEDAERGDTDSFERHYQLIVDLKIMDNESMLCNALCWRFRSLIAHIKLPAEKYPSLCERLFQMVQQLYPDKPGEAYSVLYKSFYHIREGWNGYTTFCDWWGFDNFREEDYQCETLPNGRHMSISLVEEAYLSYSKALIQNNSSEAIRSFIPRLDELAEKHPEMIYLGYYKGKLLLALGEKGESVLKTLLPFIRQKKNEFWAWQLLAEVLKEEEENALACLFRATHCKTKESFLVKVRIELAKLLMKREDYPKAKYQIEKYIEERKRNASSLSFDVRCITNESWYNSTQSSPNVDIDYMAITDKLIFSDIPETIGVVTYVNRKCMMATVIYAPQKEAYFKYDKSLREIKAGDFLAIRFDKTEENGYFVPLSVTMTVKRPSNEFYRENIKGIVTLNEKKTVGFLRGKNAHNSFISPTLLSSLVLSEGDEIQAAIVLQYNKKADKWQWACISISK
jgi:tetratricopeptide (TPR) repeat protein